MKCDTKGHDYEDFYVEKWNYWKHQCKRCKKVECEHDRDRSWCYGCCKEGVTQYNLWNTTCKRCEKPCTFHTSAFCRKNPEEDEEGWCDHDVVENGYCENCGASFFMHSYDELGVCGKCGETKVCNHKREKKLTGGGCFCKYCMKDMCDFTPECNDEIVAECKICGIPPLCDMCDEENLATNVCDRCYALSCDECVHCWEWDEKWCKKCYEDKVDQW